MENRKTKVKTREFYKEQEYQGKTQYKFFVTFEGNETKHMYTSSVKEPKYFAPGTEQEYTYELKKGNSNGQDWELHIVKPIYPKPAFGGFGGSQQLSIEDFILREKIKTVGYSMSYAVKLQEGKEYDKETIEKHAKELLTWQGMMMDKIYKSNKG